jgi:cytochrome c553
MNVSLRSTWWAICWSVLAVGAVQSPAYAQADEARARKIVGGVCFVCHGAEGNSASEVFPRLAGQHAEYTARQLEHFKTGQRKSTPDDMLALGRYFEKQSATPEPVKEPDLAAMGRYVYLHGNRFSGVPACASCHGPKALGTTQLPRLAGQHAAYLENQLKQFHQRERTNDNAVMHAIVVKMTALEMAAVAEYLSGQ